MRRAVQQVHEAARGGFTNPRTPEVLELDDSFGAFDKNAENLSPSLVGTAADALTRLTRLRADDEETLGETAVQALSVSFRGSDRIQRCIRRLLAGAQHRQADGAAENPRRP